MGLLLSALTPFLKTLIANAPSTFYTAIPILSKTLQCLIASITTAYNGLRSNSIR